MAPIRKRTIDRRRHPKGSVPTKPSAVAAEKGSSRGSDSSSVDVPTPSKVAAAPPNESESDSSADELTPKEKTRPPKEAPTAAQTESNDADNAKLDSSENESVQEPKDEEKQPPLTSVKKKTLHSKAPKRKNLTLARRPAKPAASTKRKKKKKGPPSEDEESEGDEESNVSEFEPDDDAGEEIADSGDSWESKEENKSTRRRAKKPSVKEQRRNRRNTKQSDDSEESWDSEEEEVKPTRRQTKKPAARGQRRGRRNTKPSDVSEESWESEEEDMKPKRGSAKKPARSRGRRRGRNKGDSEASWESDVDDKRKKKRKPPVDTRHSGRITRLDSSEEEEHGSPRRTPSRRSATRALVRISHDVEKDETVEEEDRAILSARKRKKKEEDEEFDPDADDAQELDADDDLGDESSAFSAAADDDDDQQYEDGNVDAQQDFLTADSSDDDAAAGPSPTLDVKYSSRSRRSPVMQDSFDSASESDEDDQEEPTLSCSPHMPECPSKTDAITMDPLPEKHLCFFSPDRQSRQCFALETLHKIALCSSVTAPGGKRTFLQPPHFRTPASDDFIDQIASRFGRAALDLNGDFYRLGRGDPDGYMLTFGANLINEATFQERLNEYMSNLMGSQDIYCCPLCYIESHRRLASLLSGEEEDVDDENQDEEEENIGEPIRLWHDPMTVLGFSDNDRFKIASTFCFTKLADVKRHLREAHNVDTKVLDSNDLFGRFKVSSFGCYTS